MHILMSGICGFVGSTLALRLCESSQDLKISGFDNLVRPGSELNRLTLRRVGIAARHADLRNASDIDALPDADCVIDAAANPSVLAGIGDQTSSRQLVEHNLSGTINLLEYCKNRRAGFILLSTSRVYSIKALSDLKLVEATLTDLILALRFLREFPRQESQKIFLPNLRCRSTAAQNSHQRLLRSSTVRLSNFRCGLIAAAYSLVRDSSAAPIMGFLVSRLILGSAGARSSISASKVAATKCAIACIRETLSRSCKSRCRFYRRGERFLMLVEESIIACL